jgi:hypothetical protein
MLLVTVVLTEEYTPLHVSSAGFSEKTKAPLL